MKTKFYHPFALELTELQGILDENPRIPKIRSDASKDDSSPNPSNPDDPIMTTMAVGEEGGDIPIDPIDDGGATTEAVGEEGGDIPIDPIDDGGATTEAVGEEGGDVTTMALGEEGGDIPIDPIDDGGATTEAIGEEGGDIPIDPIDEGEVTTLALGEEGGDIPIETIDLPLPVLDAEEGSEHDIADCVDWALFDPFPPVPIYPTPGQSSYFFDLTNEPDSVLLTPGLLTNYPGGLRGLDGSDYIVGSEDAELIHGNGECDYIVGGEGNDSVFGGKGHDRIQGNEGDDFIHGNKHEDILAGNDGNDKIYGGRDDDALTGGSGNDLLRGDRGNDTLVGVDPDYIPCGIDEICPPFRPGELERDTLIGGEGRDLFVLGDTQSVYYDDSNVVFIIAPPPDQPPPSYALIADFKAGEDTIQLKGGIEYTLNDVSLENGVSGLGIFFETDSGQNQLIGILEDVKSSQLTVNNGSELTTIT
jgi:Ca2+-binding RTX toxin-like protein